MKISTLNTDGFYNLIIIVSILSILRFLIEDYREFGFLMSIPLSEISLKDILFFSVTVSIFFLRSCISFLVVEKYGFYTFLNILFSEFFIIMVNMKYIRHVYLSGWSLILNMILLAKLISFYMYYKCGINKKEDESPVKCSFIHFLYFILVPTLCYAPEYQKNTNRNYRKILYKTFLLIGGLFLFVFVTDQYSIPSIYRIIEFRDPYTVIENAINLSLSTAFLFLIFFQLVFVCCLDILAELTLFQDSTFYQAWWNSNTVGEFWTLWNIPVHKWLRYHIYIPLRKSSFSKFQAQAVAFLISAIFHEYVLSISTKNFCGYVFLGMIAQIPLIAISDLIYKICPRLANFFFWGSFCIIGQPVVVVLYYRSKELR